jgi:hypothetical protein
MRLLVVGCVALLIGIGIGLYGASAASSIKYDYFLTGKDAPKFSDGFLNGYAAGTYDTMETIVWMANDDPQSKDDFTAANLTGLYQCLQKIPGTAEAVAWAKELWAKNQSLVGANAVVNNACQYKPAQARSNAMTGGTGKRPSSNTANHR